MTRKKRWIAALAAVFALAGSSVVWAQGGMQMIEVLFDRIHISVNGQKEELAKDSIIYNGSVYVPLRSLSEMLGAEVSWDQTDRSVNLDFIPNRSNVLDQAAEQGIYQYIAMQHNAILSDLLKALKTNDTQGMQDVRDRYAKLKEMAVDVKNNEMAATLAKMTAAVELLRGGWASKNLDDYPIAWNIFQTNADQLNQTLKAKLAAVVRAQQ